MWAAIKTFFQGLWKKVSSKPVVEAAQIAELAVAHDEAQAEVKKNTDIGGYPELKKIRERTAKEERKQAREQKHQFKNEILEDLDRYFRYFTKMRKADPDAYNLYKHIGAQFVTERSMDAMMYDNEWEHIPLRWKTVRPSFGCVLFPVRRTDRVYPRFAYFKKMEGKVANVQQAPEGWDTYITTMLFVIEGHQFTVDAPVALSPDSECRALKIRQQTYATINARRGPYRGANHVVKTEWGLPARMAAFAKENNVETAEYIEQMFALTTHIFELAQSDFVEVRAQKGNVIARFNITGEDTARLFKDRERVGNTKKRIFHAVRPHERNGKLIKLHFRGERQFVWNGYSISIVVPGKDFSAFLPELEVSAIDTEEDAPLDPGMLTTDQLGKYISEHTSHTKH